MPKPDCAVRRSDCEDIQVINTLDGFNMQPRLSVPFDGRIDVNTVTSATVFLLSLGDTLERRDSGGEVIRINQIVWDVDTSTLHVESDELLDQHTRYALIVTRRINDSSGSPVEATEAFLHFRQTVRGPYKQALLDAIDADHLGLKRIIVCCCGGFPRFVSIPRRILNSYKLHFPAVL